MLFSPWDAPTQNLLAEHDKSFDSVPPFEGPRRLHLEQFSYWRNRLLELHEDIFKTPPDSLLQLLVDRRNPLQWYTFWIAVVVLILSSASCAASIAQAWASFEALRLQKAGE
jgi:hypothetical protein